MDKKFIDSIDVSDWEIETPNGWEQLDEIGKTIEYDVFVLRTENGLELEGADKHIIMDVNGEEQYIIDLKPGDLIKTKFGISAVTDVIKTDRLENMFDFKMSAETSRTYYTNGILSHNTLSLTNIAVNMINCGLNGALISCEMPAHAMISERFGPAMFNIPTTEFKDIVENPMQLAKVIQNFKTSSVGMGEGLFDSIHPGEFFIKEYPTSTLTVPELEMYLKKLMEVKKIKLDFIIVDYINIMSNFRNPNSENTYMKIKSLSEDLRAMAQRLCITVISATQTKRGTEESSDYGSADIAEASSLSHTVDMMIGLIQTPEMYANKEYFMKVLLNRYGGYKNARKRFTVDYTKMKIFETNEPIIEDFFKQ